MSEEEQVQEEESPEFVQPKLVCPDCDSVDLRFYSISHGSQIWDDCAEAHLALGPEISFCIGIDQEMTEEQRNLINVGGNEQLEAWFRNYNIMKSAPIDFKYKTRAAQKYRELIQCWARGEIYKGPELSPEEAILTINQEEEVHQEESQLNQPDDEGEKAPEAAAVQEENIGVIGRATGFLGDQYSAVVDLGNYAVSSLESYATNSETIQRFDQKAVDILGSASDKLGYGISAATNTGATVLTKIISYTPFGCLGIGTEVEDSIEDADPAEGPESAEEKKIDETIDPTV